MALKDMDQFNYIINSIKNIINYYENNNVNDNTIRIFLSSGVSFKYRVPKEAVAHLLGVRTTDLIATRMFNSTNSYEVLKELCKKQIQISGMIKDNRMSLNQIFNKHIIKKIENFKNNTAINISDTTFVLSYDRNKIINQGELARNCDFIIFQTKDDGTILELDLVKKNNYVIPVSNRIFSDEYESFDSLKNLLLNQDISIMSSIILKNGYFDDKKFYLNESEKLLKLEILKTYKEKYDCNIDVVADCKYYYIKNKTSKNQNIDNLIFYDKIIDKIQKHKIINKNKFDNLTEQNLKLIDAINDIIIQTDTDAEKSYSRLQQQIENLKIVRENLQQENNKLKEQLNQKETELEDKNKELNKSLILAKNIKKALNEYNS